MSADAAPDQQARLATRFGRRFTAGEVIFEAGAPATEAYLLQEGRVRLIKRAGASERSLRVVRPGDLFGEQALVPGTSRTQTAVALMDGAALVLEQATFEHVLAANPAVGTRVLHQLVRSPKPLVVVHPALPCHLRRAKRCERCLVVERHAGK